MFKRFYDDDVLMGIGLITAALLILFVFSIFPTHAAAPKIEASRGSILILNADGTVLQDPQPTEEPTASPTDEPAQEPQSPSVLTEKWLTDLEAFLGTYGAIIGGVATFLVGLLKNVSFLQSVSARIISVAVSGVLVLGYLLATNWGYGVQYKGALDAIPVVGQALLGLLAAFGFSIGIHEVSHQFNIPIAGAKRTKV